MDETLLPPLRVETHSPDDKNGFNVLVQDSEATIDFPVGSDVSSATHLMGIVHDQIKNPDINLIRFDLSNARSIDTAIFGQITQAWVKAKHKRDRGEDKRIVLRGVHSPQVLGFFEENGLDKMFEFEESTKE